jgi:hypothetical protein
MPQLTAACRLRCGDRSRLAAVATIVAVTEVLDGETVTSARIRTTIQDQLVHASIWHHHQPGHRRAAVVAAPRRRSTARPAAAPRGHAARNQKKGHTGAR